MALKDSLTSTAINCMSAVCQYIAEERRALRPKHQKEEEKKEEQE